MDNPAPAKTCKRCGGALSPLDVQDAAPPVPSVDRVPGPNHPRVSFRVVRADGGPETVVSMHADVMTCGKMGDLAVSDDPFVAPHQARFFFSSGRLAVEDVGGGNGVYVRIQEREVPVGGELRMGRQRFVVETLPKAVPTTGGAIAWGSPDPGFQLRLVQILEGGVRGAVFPLKEGDNLVGREQGDITFPLDAFVSGRHAHLVVSGSRLKVKDLGSSNGTFLRLSAPVLVENGNQFLIGRQLLKVEIA